MIWYRFVGVIGFLFVAQVQAQQDRFSYLQDGNEVLDNQTNLVWRRCVEGMKWDGKTCVTDSSSACRLSHSNQYCVFSYEQALLRSLAQANTSGKPWHLPTIAELTSIVDRRHISPTIDPTVFPAAPTRYACWSSSRSVANSSVFAWDVDFYDGAVNYDLRSYEFAVRLVRQRE